MINHYDYGNEELMTDEARTNEDDPSALLSNQEDQMQYMKAKKYAGQKSNAMFFNGEVVEGLDDGDESDEEDG